MNVLVVYAHPNSKSFNHALVKSYTEGLDAAHHSYEIVDLYGINFNSNFQMADFVQFSGGTMPNDVLEQQEKISKADAIALFFPVWYWSYPAILKGWIDRVFSFGFAFKYGEKGIEGQFADKKLILISTTLAPEDVYKNSGIGEAMEKIDAANFGIVCGIKDLKHIFLYGADKDPEARARYLEMVRKMGNELS